MRGGAFSLRWFAGFLLLVGVSLWPTASSAQSEAEASLYSRLGGYDAIAGTVDDFLGRFDADPELQPFLGGLNAAASARIRQNFVDFFCARAGGPCLYTGRSMTEAHQGLSITESLFDKVIGHLGDALDANGVGDVEREELLSIARSLRSDIVAD